VIESYLRTLIEAATEADDANEWFDADLDQWLFDACRSGRAALARVRELRRIDELEAAFEEPAA